MRSGKKAKSAKINLVSSELQEVKVEPVSDAADYETIPDLRDNTPTIDDMIVNHREEEKKIKPSESFPYGKKPTKSCQKKILSR